MATETMATFESSLSELDVGLTRTDPEGFDEALTAVLDDPAIGVPLPFDDVSLGEHVNTDPTPAEFESARTGVTPVEMAIASYGTLAVQSDVVGTEPVSLYPECHVAVLRERDIQTDMDGAFAWLESEFDAGRSSVVFATGASATADMGAMVEGVHGPAEVHVVVLEQ